MKQEELDKLIAIQDAIDKSGYRYSIHATGKWGNGRMELLDADHEWICTLPVDTTPDFVVLLIGVHVRGHSSGELAGREQLRSELRSLLDIDRD